jgi:hypothetical protein
VTQPVRGSQLGTGNELDSTEELEEFAGVDEWNVTALATKPANTMEKIEAWTKSFMIWLPPGTLSELFPYAGLTIASILRASLKSL